MLNEGTPPTRRHIVALVAAIVMLVGLAVPAAARQQATPPGFVATPNPIPSFGAVPVGSSSPTERVTITNRGDDAIDWFDIKAVVLVGTSPGDYRRTTNCGEIGIGESCAVDVTFVPTGLGRRPAILQFEFTNCRSPRLCEPVSMALIGEGVPPAPGFTATPGALNFGTVALGATSAAATVTISVSGPPGAPPRPMTIRRVSIPALPGQFNGEYRITSDTCTDRTLEGGETCAVSVVFAPGGVDNRPAILRFEDDAPGNPHAVALAGTGARPTIGVNPAVTVSGGVVAVVGAGWPPGATVAITMQRLPAPVIVTAGPDGSFRQPVVVFHTSTWGPRAVTAAVQGNGAINSGPPQIVLVQAPSASPSDFVTR